MSESVIPPRSGIKSFVLRSGPMGAARRQALAQLSPRYQIPFAPTMAQWGQHFDRIAPVILEIGSGMGDTTAQIAGERSECNFLALEVHKPGVAHLLQLIETQQLSNLKIIEHDAVEVLKQMIPDGALAGVHIFFPDPWPKKRHHKRRLINPAMLVVLSQKLCVGGFVHCATDWADYADTMRADFRANVDFSAGDFVSRPNVPPHARPETKFERRGVKLGHRIFDLISYKK